MTSVQTSSFGRGHFEPSSVTASSKRASMVDGRRVVCWPCRSDNTYASKVGTLVPWQQTIAGTLDNNEIIGVAAVVRTYLEREPTLSEITSARRAALRLAEIGEAEVVHVPMTGSRPSQDRCFWSGPVRTRRVPSTCVMQRPTVRCRKQSDRRGRRTPLLLAGQGSYRGVHLCR